MTEIDFAIRARRSVTPQSVEPACVHVHDGRISAVTTFDSYPAGCKLVEVGDDAVLMPGLVDTHVHINEPGNTDWEGFATATRAAAAGGITTLVDMPIDSVPATVTKEALDAKRAAARGQCYVDVGFWGGAIPGNLAEMRRLRAGGVLGFKCFLVDPGVPDFAPLDAMGMQQALAVARDLDAPLLIHADTADGAAGISAMSGRVYGD